MVLPYVLPCKNHPSMHKKNAVCGRGTAQHHCDGCVAEVDNAANVVAASADRCDNDGGLRRSGVKVCEGRCCQRP